MQLDHLIGRPVENVDGDKITLEGDIVIHAGRTVDEQIKGFALLSVEPTDTDPEAEIHVKFGMLDENGKAQSEVTVILADSEYGIAVPGADEVAYPGRAEEVDVLPADPSPDRIAEGPLQAPGSAPAPRLGRRRG